MKNFGFTLAEVLITLGIIGVVAAMTMPSLISKFQQKSFMTAFKKQYSVLNNTLNYITTDKSLTQCYHSTRICPTETNPNNECYIAVSTDCYALKNELISNLKLTRIEKNFTYTPRDKVFSEGGTSSNRSVNYDGIFRLMDAYLIPDGAILFFRTNNFGDATDVQFVLDVNGKKGPNKWGYDVFWLCLNQKNGIIRLTDEAASLSEKGGSLPRNILLNKWSNDFGGRHTWLPWG